jgi:hypothetical protein
VTASVVLIMCCHDDAAAKKNKMDRHLEALDLASSQADQLWAAEVSLLQHRTAAPLTPSSADAKMRNWHRDTPRPAAEVWMDCLAPRLRREASREAQLLLTLPGGGWTSWVDATSAPRCSLEALAMAVLRFHCARNSGLPSAQVGAEWWVQARDLDDPMGVHFDCDEELKGSTGEHLPPFLATVTYLTSAGTPTVILPVAADARGHGVCAPPDSRADGNDACYASFPVVGKHLAFDGRLLHGTLHEGAPWTAAQKRAYADAVHGRTRTPQRVTVLVNLWRGHRPGGVEPLRGAPVAIG